MQRHLFCARSVVLPRVSHGLAVPVPFHRPAALTLDLSSRGSKRRKDLQQRREASRRSKRAYNYFGSRSWTCIWLLVLTKPAYTPRTLSQGLTVRLLMLTAITRACMNTKLRMHARLAKGSSSGACRRATGARSGGELGSGVEEGRVHRHDPPMKARRLDFMT